MKYLIYVFMLISTFSYANTELLFEKVLFKQGDYGYNTFRIPALYETHSGVLLAFAEGRKDHFRDRGNIDLVLRRSLDGGYTWQRMQIVWADGDNTCGNPTVVQDRTNGRIWLFMTHNLGEDSQSAIQDGTSQGVRTIWSCYSDDDGVTWSEPVNRHSEVQPSDIRWDATGPGRGIQMQNGEKAGRLIIPANGRNIYSDDSGESWHQSTWLPRGSSESQIVELSGGVLLRNDRRINSEQGLGRAFCKSDDYGDTWSEISYRKDLPCPRCMGSTIAVESDKPEKGIKLIFSNPSIDMGDFRRRYNMTVQSSYDEGKTWGLKKTIYPSASAYSCLSPIGDNHIGLFYENGESSLSAPELYRRMTFAKFSRDWLYRTEIFTFDFEEYEIGQRVSNAEGMIKDSNGYGLNATSDAPFRVVSCGVYGQRKAVHLNGTGRGIRIPHSKSRELINFKSDQSFTIRVIFRTTSHTSGAAAGSGALVSKDLAPNTKSWWLRVQDGVLRYHLCDGPNAVSIASNSRVSTGSWQEALIVRDAGERSLKIYLNGRLDAQINDITEGSFENDNDLYIGRFNNGRSSFNGDIALVQIFSTNASEKFDVVDAFVDKDISDIRDFVKINIK